MQSLVGGDVGGAESDFEYLIDRVQGLVDRKLRMEGTKTDTRDLLGEILFTRMRRGMQQLARDEGDRSAERAAAATTRRPCGSPFPATASGTTPPA